MCVSCGCGENSKEHKSGDITMDQIKQAAQNHNLSEQQVAQNIQQAVQQESGSRR